jgi:hypothetical protein
MATAARMPMIATTIINSIRVKPFCIVFMSAGLRVDKWAAAKQPLTRMDAMLVPMPGSP